MKFKYFIIISFLCLTGSLSAQTTPQLEAAAEAYEAGDFQKAASLYQQLSDDGQQSETLYYNLGNSYYKSGELGKAILNYERALLIDANDKDVLHNLGVARLQLIDEVSEIPPFFLERWWKGLRQCASAEVWGLLGLLLFWLGIGGLALWQMGKDRSQKKKGFLAGVVLLLLSLLPVTLAWSAYQYQLNSEEGIILSKEVALRSGADKLSQEKVVLHEGTKVKLLDLIGSWYKVRLANGEEGWIAAGTFEEI